MKFLTFNGDNIQEGMSIEVMAKAMKQVAKKNPKSTLDDLPDVACLNWSKSVGKGVVEIESGGIISIIEMPSKNAVFLPGDSVVRLRPKSGAGYTMTIAPSGTYDSASGADAILALPLMPKEGDDPERVDALNWLRTGRIGASSYTLCVKLTGVFDPRRDDDRDNPWDAGDFKRCQKFFEAVPSAKSNIGQMKDVSPQWAALAPAWSELEDLLAKELAGGEPRLSERMRELLDKPLARPNPR